MNRIAISTVCTLALLSSLAAHADDTAALAQKVVDVALTPALLEAFRLDKPGRGRGQDAGMLAAAKQMNEHQYKAGVGACTTALQKEFTADELKQLVQAFEQPVMKKFLERKPELIKLAERAGNRSLSENPAVMQDLMKQMQSPEMQKQMQQMQKQMEEMQQ